MHLRSLPVALGDLLEQDAILPICPAVFIRLTTAISDPDQHQLELAEILSSDPGLTSRVLHVANSAFYGMSRQVRSINDAILRVGIREIWSIASALQAKTFFRSESGWSEFNGLLWEHALRTAAASRVLGLHLRTTYVDEAYTASLLHDLGKSVLHSFEAQYALICRNGALSGRELTYIEADFFGTTHAQIGGELMRYWNLPESLAGLVARHHDDLPEDVTKSDTNLLLALSNQFSHAMASPMDDLKESLRLMVSKNVLDAAELDLETCQRLAVEAQKQFAALANT